MAPNEDPFVARRQLRSYLRRLRDDSGMTQVTAAGAANITATKLARIESGETTVEVNDLRFLLDAYGVPAEAQQEWIERARVSKFRSTWQNYKAVVSREFMTFLAHESLAKTLYNFEPFLMPGLLQTPEYSKAVLSVLAPEENVAALVQLRKERQTRFRETGHPGIANFVIDEAVLYRQVGGADVMRAQLQHLQEIVGAWSNTAVHVVPFREGLYPHWREPFVLFDFEVDVAGAVLYLEGPAGEHIIRESSAHEEPAEYLSDFFLLQQMAPTDKTAGAVGAALADIDRQAPSGP
jgi:transcriptional regulator with XRE-family HTH domain